jgi:hypothetical protein
MGAVADYLGRPVASVHLTVEGHETTESMLTQVVETAPGQLLSMSQVRSSIAHLFSLGRFEDVRVDATLDNEGVVLRYDLIPIHPVGRMRFAIPPRCQCRRHAMWRHVDRHGTSRRFARVADMTRLIAIALASRGTCMRRCRRDRSSSTPPSARRWSSRSIRGRGRPSASSVLTASPWCPRPISSRVLG